ncbi:MAG: hypothetical protein LBD53_07360 [Tannerella sp.]|jgi:magnesium-transporting ATPase (P-type)|nr:hypothetical protein [Tannerella sp.]
MAVTQIRRISSWMLLLIVAVSIGVFAMFFLGGNDDPIKEFKNPTNTSMLLYWIYILFAITAAALVIFGVLQFASNLMSNPKKAISTLVVLGIFGLLLFISYSMGDTTPIAKINAESEKYNTEGWLKTTDMWLYTIYVILGLSFVAIVWGSVQKIITK